MDDDTRKRVEGLRRYIKQRGEPMHLATVARVDPVPDEQWTADVEALVAALSEAERERDGARALLENVVRERNERLRETGLALQRIANVEDERDTARKEAAEWALRAGQAERFIAKAEAAFGAIRALREKG